jgi:hypothetical protein
VEPRGYSLLRQLFTRVIPVIRRGGTSCWLVYGAVFTTAQKCIASGIEGKAAHSKITCALDNVDKCKSSSTLPMA